MAGGIDTRSEDRDVEAAMRIASRELGAQRARLDLFGSRARGQAARASDIDIAIVPEAPLLPGRKSRAFDPLSGRADACEKPRSGGGRRADKPG